MLPCPFHHYAYGYSTLIRSLFPVRAAPLTSRIDGRLPPCVPVAWKCPDYGPMQKD
jgi:hypothetical protein